MSLFPDCRKNVERANFEKALVQDLNNRFLPSIFLNIEGFYRF